MTDASEMTANEARGSEVMWGGNPSQEVHKRIKLALELARERMSYVEFCRFHPLYVVCLNQQEQIDNMLARIEALEAAARQRAGDGR